MIDTSVIDGIIFGRVEPNIYAFQTATVPDFLKVGDTYRPVAIRLEEWRSHFPNLKKVCEYPATTSDKSAFFRDFAIHYFLESTKGRHRLEKEEIPNLPYYSREFFKYATEEDIKEAIEDILCAYREHRQSSYQFYKFDNSRVPITYNYSRTEQYEPRPNQQAAIDRFKEALNQGRNNLLMFAVMRFGKSFTAMCCAVEMNAKLVVIVSAKADVKEEWKKTVESHIRFLGYEFADSDSLMQNPNYITNTISSDRKKVAIFLTLQDLQGKQIKDKHKDIFSQKIDLLIIDETHFGARAEKYGQAISLTTAQLKKELEDCDEDLNDLGDSIKVLDAKIRLHLSGTPYRILMGDEFRKEDIIAFYQFTDIVKDQEEWDKEYLISDTYLHDEIGGSHKKGEEVKEWHNPYFGFPQMIRFAFNLNKEARDKIEELRSQGVSTAFSELFSVVGKKFKYEGIILELFKVIDGSKHDDNVLSFLEYEKIKTGKMCHHIVCVLPFRASCDALESLLKKYSSYFKNLGTYEIINIAGLNRPKNLDDIQQVKARIKQFEAQGKKTISLTVNRMLTGSTVEEWDTMLFLKDTSSPQEYDQATFRLQSQYVRSLISENGDTIKYNMKPQTLLVDFSPSRMFCMQELKSKIYDVNIEQNGNSNLESRIREELRISPIVCVNAENKLVEVTATDVMDEVRKYNESKSVMDEAQSITIDNSILNIEAIKEAIRKLNDIDDRKGLNFKPHEGDGDGDDVDVPDTEETGIDKTKEDQHKEKPKTESPENQTTEENLTKKLATFYSQILFFAFLTDSKVISLTEIIESINLSDDNKRIAKNLGLNLNILNLFLVHCNPFILSDLDYKIQNINDKSHDENLTTQEKVEHALNKFGKLSISEVVTPSWVAKQIIDQLPEETANGKILDIASKEGEFAIELINRFGDSVKSKIFSIPTSSVSYEFTLKIYKLLGMPQENIFSDFNSYDLFEVDPIKYNETIINKLKIMKFSTIVGNPPYQKMDEGHGASAKPIYHHFVYTAQQLQPTYISMIMPSRWYAGGKGGELVEFRKKMAKDKHLVRIDDYRRSSDCFENVEIKGGVCYFLWNNEQSIDECRFVSHSEGKIESDKTRLLIYPNTETIIRFNDAISILEKVQSKSLGSFNQIVSSRKPFGLASNFRNYEPVQDSEHSVFIYAQKDKGYASPTVILRNHEWKDKFKIYIPEAIGRGDMTQDVLKPILGEPNTICSETYILIGPFDEKVIAERVLKYIKTKFFHFMLGLKKNSQHTTQKEYIFVPMLNFRDISVINWELKERADLDMCIYNFFGFSPQEIQFIEKSIPIQ